ncbi:MAG TPA: hypothetical protein VMM76_17160 [Pirellulaceae bacterium]|nr:hypothetical protein [Pirellulaceae bacterium]
MTKKSLHFLMIAAIGVSLTFGCGQKAPEPTGETAPPASESAHSMGMGAMQDKAKGETSTSDDGAAGSKK